MEVFKISNELEAVCEWVKTRTAFKHVATLVRNGIKINSTKICYVNRTWERYTYESVLGKLKSKSAAMLSDEETKLFEAIIGSGGKGAVNALRMTATVALLGDALCQQDTRARNDWKKRMLVAGLGASGLEMPADWDTLSEEVKEKRLNAAIESIK